ncbi:thioredoxin domain-containing protein [Nocardioides sp. BP30]|uniref:DsbA family protein n=1 Tax=Nocardioides sp. BP30 TaxID=3036374 RepID=UPI0024696CE8|nr:thioredoxin domain-containing protein [Nocardioides sp. BP30]WGL51590.1 thioredoxin domain-containing protein [Nocardioides sp. BP30]
MSKRDERAAAAARLAEEARRRERRGVVVKVSALVLALIAIVAVCVVIGLSNGGDGKVDTDAATSSDNATYSLSVGNPSAPHTIVIYEDFLCPFCDQLELASRDKLAQLAADGKVYLQYRPFRLLSPDYSGQALNAFAVVLTTSGPDVAKRFHDLLYENQPEESGPFPKVSELVDLAVKAGAEESAVRAGIEDTSSQKAWTDGATRAAQKAHVEGTPTILLDGRQFQDGDTVPELAANLIKAVS